MITVSIRFLVPIGTWHIKTPFDLPAEHYQYSKGPFKVEITIGPRTAAAPAHSQQLSKIATPNVHAEPHPDAEWDGN